MNKEQDKERIEEIDKIVNEGFNLSVKEILNCIEGKISDQERDKRLKLFNNDCLERIKKSLTSFKHSIRTEVGEEIDKIKKDKVEIEVNFQLVWGFMWRWILLVLALYIPIFIMIALLA